MIHRTTVFLFLALASLFSIASFAHGPFNADAEARILLQRDAEWANAARAGKDVDKIVSYWSDDAIVIEPGAPPLVGKAAIREFVAQSLKTPGFHIHWVSEKPEFSADGSMAWMPGADEMTVPGADGKLTTLHTQGVSIWRRSPGGPWLCVADIATEAPSPQARGGK